MPARPRWFSRRFSHVCPASLCILFLAGGGLAPGAAAADEPKISGEYRAALRQGDASQLRKGLDRGWPANGRDAHGDTPLLLAASYGDSACVRLLLQRGAAVNVTNAAGATPLLRAADDFEKMRLLVEHGALVNQHSGLGNTPLMLAARPRDSYRAVEYLLAHGAEVDATNLWGATALMAAVASEDHRSIALLLKHGADPNRQPMMDRESFIFGGGRSPLMWAAYRGDLEAMKLLVDAGADVNAEGMLGTPLSQAAWGNHTEAARFLLARGARVNEVNHGDSYSALHWAASSERDDASLVQLLLQHGANPNLGGGENIDAFLDVPQTPLMLARRRGETSIVRTLLACGATNETPDTAAAPEPLRGLPEKLDAATVRTAISQAIPPLQKTSIESKRAFVNHSSHQDCSSCHQQFLPLAALGQAHKLHVPVDAEQERELVRIISAGEAKRNEADWEALFHPEPVHTKGYAMFGYACAGLAADEYSDASVHHLATIQAPDGRWYNNLPRPPMQTSDVGATALALHALQEYPLPGHKAEFAKKVEQARRWLWQVKAENNEERVYQLLGLAWAGEPASRLQPLGAALVAQQRRDGGWAQLSGLVTDAYATAQAVYALRVAAGTPATGPAIERGRRYLLSTQLEDGTWHVHRRAFPFQPTMKNNGFPHGRDAWISAAATSWAVLALGVAEVTEVASSQP